MRKYILVLMLCAVSSFAQQVLSTNSFGSLRAREIGPATCSGRITAIEAVYLQNDPKRDKDKRLCMYVGTAAGGIFKSKDNATTFTAIFDKEKNLSIGCMAIDPRHQDSVVWVGTGESNVRNSVSIGGGLYKTTDAGETWKLLGLEKVERIAKVALNPKNPDIALVAGLGALWGDSQERGLYRTSDGGKTFERVLYVDEKTGCADVVIDPSDPNICYASMWQFRRKAYQFESGGPGSGFYKSIDGGKTWKKLTNTLPEGDLGRVLIAIAPSNTNVVYAMMESSKSGLYRSTDKGESWELRSTAVSVTARPFYFSCLYVDPYDENRVFRPSFQLGISEDGGKSFNGFSYGGGDHPDHHALWIDPLNPQHLLLGTDGGVYRSYDRGSTWRQSRNLSVGQFYHISYDFEDPYNVFGGLQDNGSWMVPHQIPGGAIQNRNWESTGWGDGFTVLRDRFNKDIIYFESQGGSIVRRHLSTSESKPIQPFEEAGERKLRFNWNAPIAQSERNPKVIYMGSQYLHKSTDHGDTWQRISIDLTTNDSLKYNPVSSGGVTKDNTSAENHCTLYTIAESRLDEKIIWVGTDDGNVQVTTDGGKTWNNVAPNVPSSLPKGTWVSCVEPSGFAKGTAYVTFENHTRGDMKPYVFKTTDFGMNWKQLQHDSIVGFAHVIREDRVNKDLLFLGTELGMYISIDGGTTWARFKNGVPYVPVRDIQIHPTEHDVIIATHGRGAMIIDDITPLRTLTTNALQNELTFLQTRPSPISFASGFQEFTGSDEFVGSNPAGGAKIAYYMKGRHMVGDMKVEILDAAGKVISTVPAGKRKGLNLLYWNMSVKPPKVAVSENTGGGNWGYNVLPGTYQVRITKNGKVFTGSTTIVEEKKSIHKKEDRVAQYDAMKKLYGLIEDLAYATEQVRTMKSEIAQRADALKQDASIQSLISNVKVKLDTLHKDLVADKSSLFADTEDKLREKLANIYGTISQYAGRPSAEQLKRVANLESDVRKAEKTIASIIANDLNSLNKALVNTGSKVIPLVNRSDFDKREE